MSSNSKIIISLFLIISLSSCSINQFIMKSKKDDLKENILISLALDYEFYKQYNNSIKVYEELYKMNSNSYEYLFKLIYLNRVLKNYKEVQNITYANLDIYEDKKDILTKEYILASLKLKQYDKALKFAKELLDDNNTANNYTIVADVYYFKKDYSKALTYYESAYAKNHDVKALLNLCDILYVYLDKKNKAISYLQTHSSLYKFNTNIYYRLLSYYEQNNDIKNMLIVANNLYDNLKIKFPNKTFYKLSNLIVNLYIKIDIKKAIEFLEKNEYDNEKLLSLYSSAKMHKKALKLMQNIYKKEKNDELLGQIAILQYEINKNKISNEIINNFELSLKKKSNDNYENYYGYILIDHNINIKKGLKLIKKAYDKSPNNIAYKDSLAYAYYKNNQCKSAYDIMNKIVKKIGTSNKDIKEHWEKIKKCKEEIK